MWLYRWGFNIVDPHTGLVILELSVWKGKLVFTNQIRTYWRLR